MGGAIYQGNATNCKFESNSAGENGGALNQANAYNCTFTGNIAKKDGGAIDNGRHIIVFSKVIITKWWSNV